MPKAIVVNSKATHGLVFMFQPLADSYTQPVGVFASRGSANGIKFSKLIIKAVSLLEKLGIYIHGFVSDEAQSNNQVWTEFGISGKLKLLHISFTHIEHFLNPKRKFAFSGTPHLIKHVN